MRKRQKSRRKNKTGSGRHTGNRQLDHRDQDWLTRGERFEAQGVRESRRRQGKLDKAAKLIDVSLHEYADNPQAPPSSRLSKAKGTTVVLHKVKMETTALKEEEVADDWFLEEDSDLEELVDDDNIDETTVTEESPDAKDTAKDQPGVEDIDQEAFQYPPDIWYIISNYISPLQVGCFAAICRDAYNVSTTAAFWKSLYQRFHSPDTRLPVELQSFSMSRTYGIRALVIRALHIMYEPYANHIKSLPPIAEDADAPSSLVNQTCLYTWSRGQVGCHYNHYLKFQAEDTNTLLADPFNEDVYFNPHKKESILKVFCQNFQHFPTDQIMGTRLVNVSVSVSSNFRYHKLKLQFTRTRLRGRPRDSDLVSVIFDPVILVRVLSWWHPQFQECLNQGSTFGTTNTLAAASAVWEGRI